MSTRGGLSASDWNVMHVSVTELIRHRVGLAVDTFQAGQKQQPAL